MLLFIACYIQKDNFPAQMIQGGFLVGSQVFGNHFGQQGPLRWSIGIFLGIVKGNALTLFDAGPPQDDRFVLSVSAVYLFATLDVPTVAGDSQSIGLAHLFVFGFVLGYSRHVQHSTLVAQSLSKFGLPTIQMKLREGLFSFWFWRNERSDGWSISMRCVDRGTFRWIDGWFGFGFHILLKKGQERRLAFGRCNGVCYRAHLAGVSIVCWTLLQSDAIGSMFGRGEEITFSRDDKRTFSLGAASAYHRIAPIATMISN
mmetsp:Transcript_15492/g.39031  ORF Transcript_15492/g.39031 Transcript_15492/m.39031 type:complete len:258 (+) Transcript_15492:410-1183(+)